jgi:hypothetical protein
VVPPDIQAIVTMPHSRVHASSAHVDLRSFGTIASYPYGPY